MDKKKVTKVATMIMITAGSAVIGFMAAKFGMDSAKTAPASEVITMAILLVPAFFIVVGIHEAGHALAGTLVNFDFRMYVVGPFMWDKEESGWKFKWNKNVNLAGGLVISLPTTKDNLARRFSVYASGGPIFSLFLTLITLMVNHLITFLNTNNSVFLHTIGSFFWLLSLLSLLIFILTALPFHAGGFYTDGARIIRFLRGGDTSRFEVLLLKILSSSSGGTRPRLLDEKELDEATALALKLKAPMGVYLHAYYYQMALDHDNFDKAETHLKNYISEVENIPKGIQSAVWLDATFFYAFARKDIQQAEYYWSLFKPSAILPKSQIHACEAALHLLKGHRQLADNRIEAALKELENMIDRGVGIALREKLIQMKHQVKE